MKILIELRQSWREWRCGQRPDGHWWRPCSYRLHPAKVCDDCGKVVDVTEAEFYAEFAIHFTTITSMPAVLERPHGKVNAK